jgi:nucleoside diphosphate kinase
MSMPLDILAAIKRQDDLDEVPRSERVMITDAGLAALWDAWDEADGAAPRRWDAITTGDGEGTITSVITDSGNLVMALSGPRRSSHAAAAFAAFAKTAFVPLVRRLALAEATVRDLCEEGRAVQVLRELRRQNDVLRAALETIRGSYTTSAVAYRVSQAALVEANREPE